MTRAPRLTALAGTALLLGMLAFACGGSESGEAPPAATEPPATETATETATATATEPPATATPSPAATATEPTPTEAAPEEPDAEGDLSSQIVTLLPPDAIPAINDPRLISAEEADEQLRLTDLVIGVSIDGEHRAYGAAFLSGHEIVNDMLGGRAIAVTW